ncbi:hypothetical protein DPMN_097771 [Dreissena polymorpha]|uniref:Uncharacterized protein n=1 Tax=Dreissena polymorpha TaxID=45954 RepID=A0A9D4LDG5_DREPO|nr:hypothetical protein DPMN_097771 [Dreissena polymorpha]
MASSAHPSVTYHVPTASNLPYNVHTDGAPKFRGSLPTATIDADAMHNFNA